MQYDWHMHETLNNMLSSASAQDSSLADLDKKQIKLLINLVYATLHVAASMLPLLKTVVCGVLNQRVQLLCLLLAA